MRHQLKIFASNHTKSEARSLETTCNRRGRFGSLVVDHVSYHVRSHVHHCPTLSQPVPPPTSLVCLFRIYDYSKAHMPHFRLAFPVIISSELPLPNTSSFVTVAGRLSCNCLTAYPCSGYLQYLCMSPGSLRVHGSQYVAAIFQYQIAIALRFFGTARQGTRL